MSLLFVPGLKALLTEANTTLPYQALGAVLVFLVVVGVLWALGRL